MGQSSVKRALLPVRELSRSAAHELSDFVSAPLVRAAYGGVLKTLRSRRSSMPECAVVVHLYYADAWPLLSRRLEYLSTTPYDLYVSVPKHLAGFSRAIGAEHPNACVVEVPNRGRDVLPFLEMASHLSASGYSYVLKLHSKSSTHVIGRERQYVLTEPAANDVSPSDPGMHVVRGSRRMADMVASLIPENSDVMRDVLGTLGKAGTGIIGPKGYYYSLAVTLDGTARRMRRVIEDVYSDAAPFGTLWRRKESYGFFAGTMFWARLDAIEPLLGRGYHAGHFERERGQMDGTFAHGLERALCVVPELDGRDMYELDATGVSKVGYSSGRVPEWYKP